MCSSEVFEEEDEENGDEGVGVDKKRGLCLSRSSALVSTGRGFGRFLGDAKKSLICNFKKIQCSPTQGSQKFGKIDLVYLLAQVPHHTHSFLHLLL